MGLEGEYTPWTSPHREHLCTLLSIQKLNVRPSQSNSSLSGHQNSISKETPSLGNWSQSVRPVAPCQKFCSSQLPSEEKPTVSEISGLFTKQAYAPSVATVNVQSVRTGSFKGLEGIVVLHIQGPRATLSECCGVFPGFYTLGSKHSVGGLALPDNGLSDKRPTFAVC